jgi:EAL domain-containing protein (putative c-di-GMP-specific phosphodiesterase class I)
MKIGIYEYDGGNETPIEVYNRARIACEQGAEQESGIFYYKKEFEIKRKEFFEISGSLIEAINKKEMYLVYQPKINIADNTIFGTEVLIRWDRGDKKPVGTNAFIKLAEDIGFIKEISKFVLINTCRQIADWNEKGIDLNVSMNFTGNELLDDDFVEWGKKVIQDYKINPSRLELEITERVISNNNEKLIERLHNFRAKGYKISIDDCGTGINSLVMMADTPCDQLKIDKYFIDHIDRIEIKELIKAIINYAHELNKTVVAEGVETAEQLKVLRDLKCDIVQGYYYSKPLLPQEFEAYYFDFYFKRYAVADRNELLEKEAVS